ncbi:outer membrane beta-barrel protein [Thalassotalea psychrophila]|uniref:Outer membrane beta-barrel protein n=1 Tax=Thalassotalea psychrophila TaxID=3065647 RepID=A0ABY9TZB7_9GAMM|nr:outer membrane beta-barrel protein [Colwelliaceae bacterium SQ149]
MLLAILYQLLFNRKRGFLVFRNYLQSFKALICQLTPAKLSNHQLTMLIFMMFYATVVITAKAQTSETVEQTFELKPYIGIGLGNWDTGVSELDDDLGMEFYIGAKFNTIFAVEFGGFYGYSEQVDSNSQFELDSYSLAGVAHYPLNQHVDLVGKLGIYYWDTELRKPDVCFILCSDGEKLNSDSGLDMFFSYGINVHISRSLSLGLAQSHYSFDSLGYDADSTMTSVRLTWWF